MNKLMAFMQDTSAGRFFIPFGIILLVMSFFFAQFSNQTKGYIKTSATVTRSELVQAEDPDTNQEATYDVYVTYEIDGKTYEDVYYGERPGLKEGQTITIAYNPNNPTEIVQPINLVIPIVMAIGGVAAIIGGIISTVRNLQKRKMLKEQEEMWKHGS